MDTETVKLLVVNTGTEPISLTKIVIPSTDRETIHDTILSNLNKFGKLCHILAKYGNRYFILDHTARKGHNKTYHKVEVEYHRYMKELT